LSHYIRIRLKPKEEDRLLAGHPWVFANEVEKFPPSLTPGSLVEVVTAKEVPVGRGVANPTSKILVRLLAYDFETEIDDAFIANRVLHALKLREGFGKTHGTDGMRLLFGEGDGLPGLIVDGFGQNAVLSCFSAGLKPFIPVINMVLTQQGYPHVYEKTVGEVCQKEGMPEFSGWLTPEGTFPLTFTEGKAKFQVRPDQGHKTGFYLDFREGRRRFAEMSRDKKVLDAFCYTGGASIQAALAGAAEVVGIEASQTALDEAALNAEANGVGGKIRFQKQDTFQALKELRKTEGAFDGILLDPPPLAKSAHDIPAARLAFKRMVSQALGLLKPGGFLILSTCSHHFSWNLLEGVTREATEDSGRSFRLLERLTQPQDHPIVLSIPETEYLRALVLTEADF